MLCMRGMKPVTLSSVVNLMILNPEISVYSLPSVRTKIAIPSKPELSRASNFSVYAQNRPFPMNLLLGVKQTKGSLKRYFSYL